jgi:hypothetical protein
LASGPSRVPIEKGQHEPVDFVGAIEVRAVPGAADDVVVGIGLPFGPVRHRLADVAGLVGLSNDQLRRYRGRIAGFGVDARADSVHDLQELVLGELVERAAQVLT